LIASNSRRTDYPLGFKLLTAVDAACAVLVVGYAAWVAATKSPLSVQMGQAVWLTLNAAIVMALVLLLWRYRLRTAPDSRKKSVYALLILITLLFLANALIQVRL